VLDALAEGRLGAAAPRGLWRQLLRYGGKDEVEIARITADPGARPSPRSSTPRA
jgi:hypothetical protein